VTVCSEHGNDDAEHGNNEYTRTLIFFFENVQVKMVRKATPWGRAPMADDDLGGISFFSHTLFSHKVESFFSQGRVL
jgi:hypothetical protein